MVVTQADLEGAIQRLGLTEQIVCLHTSLKSFGIVEGGAEAVLRSFLQQGCTLLVPAFCFISQVDPPQPNLYRQNGGAAEETKGRDRGVGFDPRSQEIDPSLGLLPRTVLEHPESYRGTHLLNALAAVGPFARELAAAQTQDDVYGPYKLAHKMGRASLLLMGVSLTRATPMHLAEEMAGRRLFRRWARRKDGEIIEVAIGSCSEGFEAFTPFLQEVETQLTVGHSLWRCFDLGQFLDTAAAIIRQHPNITHCQRAECLRCDDAVAGGPVTG